MTPPLTIPALADRWSPRRFDPDHEVPPETLTRLLQAARWAPSFGNTQPWRFVVLRRGSADHARLLPLLTRGNSAWVPSASVVLIGAAHTGWAPDQRKPPTGDYAFYDLGQSVAHLTIQAVAEGLQAHQFAGFDHEAAHTAFALPEHLTVTVGVAVGRPLMTTQEELARDEADYEQGTRKRRARPRVRKDLADLATGDLP